MTAAYDVAIVGDFRFPGGTSTCIAQEIMAQAASGYTTALVPVWSDERGLLRGFHPEIIRCLNSGKADLIRPGEHVHAKFAALHHPNVFSDRELLPDLSFDDALLIAHQLPRDGSRKTPYYDAGQVEENIQTKYGHKVAWAPVGPLARQSFERDFSHLTLAPQDWHNLIDVDQWSVRKHLGGKPIIGRHGRPSPQKWPTSRQIIRQVYPDSADYVVKILGGAHVAQQFLGRIPRNWEVWEFNQIHPKVFLSSIHYFVYFHHPEWIEAFGRTILEALASGTPAILPGHFRELFGDSCLYAAPEEVTEVIDRLHADPERYHRQAKKGQDFVREHFGFEVHAKRLAARVGPPSGAPRAVPQHASDPKREPVIFMTSNGEGMGHLTRILALARRAGQAIEPIIVTMSPALQIAADHGFRVEYIPRYMEWEFEQREPLITQRLASIVDRYQVKTIVFDGTVPYRGAIEIKNARDVRFIWMRRGLWQAGAGRDFLERGQRCDLVLEPGEIAAPLDQGLTRAYGQNVVAVNPVVYCREDDILPRQEARKRLGIRDDRLVALLMLGSDKSNAIGEPAKVAGEWLARRDVQVVAANWLIAQQHLPLCGDAIGICEYPLAKYFAAADFAIAAPGYNTFHELVAAAMPTIFVPMEKETEAQGLRSLYASKRGAALNVCPYTSQNLVAAMELMMSAKFRDCLAQNCRELWPGNGARDAVSIVEKVALGTDPEAFFEKKQAGVDLLGMAYEYF